MIKYWYTLLKQPDALMFKLLHMNDIHGNNLSKWYVDVKSLPTDLGFGYLCDIVEYCSINDVHVTDYPIVDKILWNSSDIMLFNNLLESKTQLFDNITHKLSTSESDIYNCINTMSDVI